MANKTADEIAVMVQKARQKLDDLNRSRMRGNSERDAELAEAQMKDFRNFFQGWTSQDLMKLQEALLQSFDKDMEKVPLSLYGTNDPNPDRIKLNKSMQQVFQNLFDIERVVRTEEKDVNRAEVVEGKDERSTVLASDGVEPKLDEKTPSKSMPENKTLLQKIKAIVDKGVEAINIKAAEVKTNMETKQQIRKAVKEFKGQGNILQIISKNAEKARNAIKSLGERAVAKIMSLKKNDDIEMQISSPTDFKHVEGQSNNNKAKMQAFATLDTSHASLLSEAEVKPEDIKEFNILDDQEVIPGLKQSQLDELLKDVKSSDNPVSQEDLDALLAEPESAPPNVQAEAVVQQLEQDVKGEEQKFSDLAKTLESLAVKEDVKMATGINDLKKPAPTAGELAVQQKQDQMMSDLDAALKAIDDAGPEKGTSKTADPGTPKSGNDSGPSTPRAGH